MNRMYLIASIVAIVLIVVAYMFMSKKNETSPMNVYIQTLSDISTKQTGKVYENAVNSTKSLTGLIPSVCIDEPTTDTERASNLAILAKYSMEYVGETTMDEASVYLLCSILLSNDYMSAVSQNKGYNLPIVKDTKNGITGVKSTVTPKNTEDLQWNFIVYAGIVLQRPELYENLLRNNIPNISNNTLQTIMELAKKYGTIIQPLKETIRGILGQNAVLDPGMDPKALSVPSVLTLEQFATVFIVLNGFDIILSQPVC
jgi:hypothetical protein